jgi:hypothetical protein
MSIGAKAAILLWLGILFSVGPVWIDLAHLHGQSDGPGMFFLTWGAPAMFLGAAFLLAGIVCSVC